MILEDSPGPERGQIELAKFMLFAKLTIHVLDCPPLPRVWIHARQDEIEHAGPVVVTELRDGLEDLVIVERDAQSLFTIQTEALVAQRERDDAHVPALRSSLQDALEEIDGAFTAYQKEKGFVPADM